MDNGAFGQMGSPHTLDTFGHNLGLAYPDLANQSNPEPLSTPQLMPTGPPQRSQPNPNSSRRHASSGSVMAYLEHPHTRSVSELQPSCGQSTFGTRPVFTFGSDSAFQARYYAPPAESEDVGAVEGRMLDVLATLEPQRSASSTQPSSPTLSKHKRRQAAIEEPDTRVNGAVGADNKNNNNNSARYKRARHTNHNSLSTSDDPSVPMKIDETLQKDCFKTSPRRPRETLPRAPRRQSDDSKPPRQNLTEDEKKQNHIKSEQKRRNQIKAGFADLVQLLPETSSAGPSKCVILTQAVEWLSGLIEGNKRLRAQLESLGGEVA